MRMINGAEEGIACMVWAFFATAYFGMLLHILRCLLSLIAFLGPDIWTTGWKTTFNVTFLPLPDLPLNLITIGLLGVSSVVTGLLKYVFYIALVVLTCHSIQNVIAYLRKNGRSPAPAVQRIFENAILLLFE